MFHHGNRSAHVSVNCRLMNYESAPRSTVTNHQLQFLRGKTISVACDGFLNLKRDGSTTLRFCPCGPTSAVPEDYGIQDKVGGCLVIQGIHLSLRPCAWFDRLWQWEFQKANYQDLVAETAQFHREVSTRGKVPEATGYVKSEEDRDHCGFLLRLDSFP